MDTSESKPATSVLEPRIEQRSKLYYDRFAYCLDFRMREAGCARMLNHASLEARLQMRRIWGAKVILTQQEQDNLHDLVSELTCFKHDYKTVFYQDWVYVYSNDLAQLQSLAQQSFVKHANFKQANLSLSTDTILLKSSQYQYRSYFKNARLTQEQRDTLQRFLQKRLDYFGVSRHFRSKINGRWFYLLDYNYVDHQDLQDITMLHLVCPGIVRKTLRIQTK